MKYRTLGNTGVQVPAVGQGTYGFGQDPSRAAEEVEAIRYGIAQGMTLIDTAEMYADGKAEEIVGEAISDCRDDVFVVTKVWPTNSAYDNVLRAAERSVKRLGGTPADLYLVHWPSSVHPLQETMRAMDAVVREGFTRYIGVSNFTPELLTKAANYLQDNVIVANQVSYSLQKRAIENNVIPYCAAHDISVIGYSPFAQGTFNDISAHARKLLQTIGDKYDKTVHQVALNWLLRQPSLIAIPKAGTRAHLAANATAVDFELRAADAAEIDRAFPLPKEGMPLITHPFPQK
ncbi:aldo/keto reductase [Numidum massiliense]|uniref:aldo/keto reductase n=1 Tax=Numidum massiliense TaxID=1522315 RepID=UPI0006D53B45|nr:aldo/keto reductase [Numidum massiliense]